MHNQFARTPAALLVASVLSFAFAAPVSAEIYKWTDTSGVVHYTNTRPSSSQPVKLVRENRLSIVAPLRPSAEEVRALNDRLADRRISRLEEELRAQRSGPAVAYAPPADLSGVYYPGGGGFYGPSDAPLGEIVIDAGNDVVVSPVDGTVSQCGQLEDNLLLQAKGQRYSLQDLLAGDAEAVEVYRGGSFACIYLAPYNYHRIHMPYAGTARGNLYVPGDLFSVNATTVGAVPRVFARNERLICDFATPLGRMAVRLSIAVK